MIDIHSHLELLKDLDLVIERAKKNRVMKIVTAGTDVKTDRFALKKSEEYLEICCMMGIYPDDALLITSEEIDEEIEFIRKNKDKIIGIGEVGIDFKNTKDIEDRNKQEEIFRKFILLSLELDKPILVHSRDAEKKSIEILEEMNCKKVIMHCFSGDIELVERIYRNGWYFSIPTCICYNKHFEEIVKLVSLDKLFCETDSPFMHPEGRKAKKRNEPANVKSSYEIISRLNNITIEEVKKQINDNYKSLFG